MVQEFAAEPRIHKFTFEMVMVAYERRFPNCQLIPIVEDTELTQDVWSPDNSQRETTRRAKLRVEAPYLLRRVVGVDYVYFIQKTKMDLKKRTMDIEAVNESFSNRVNITERCKYFVDPVEPQWTCFTQDATLHVISFYGCEGPLEKVAMSQYAALNSKAKQLIELFMEQVIEDGITEVKPWSPYDPKYNLKLRALISHEQQQQQVKEAEPEAHGSGKNPMDQLGELGSSPTKKLSTTELKKGSSSNPSSTNLKSVLDSVKSTNLQNQDSVIIPPRTKSTKTPEYVQQVALNPPFPYKPCQCEPVIDTRDSSLLTSWENLIMTLLCTIIIIIAFSTMPILFLFHQRR